MANFAGTCTSDNKGLLLLLLLLLLLKLGEDALQLIKRAVHKMNFGSYGSGTAL